MNKPASELIALADKCRELLDWHRTGILVDGEVRKLAATLGAPTTMEHTKLHIAETQIAAEAMEAVVRTAANQSGSDRAGVDALREALTNARQKLQLYRAEHCGIYIGGVEYTQLIKQIDAALATPPAQPAPAGTHGLRDDASEQDAESAIRHLKIVIDAAENSNQSGENAVVRAAIVTGWKRP